LKKVQGKKKRDNENAEAKRKELAEAAAADSSVESSTEKATPKLLEDEQPSGSGDILNDKDEDVIF
jgi:hypothetical protein